MCCSSPVSLGMLLVFNKFPFDGNQRIPCFTKLLSSSVLFSQSEIALVRGCVGAGNSAVDTRVRCDQIRIGRKRASERFFCNYFILKFAGASVPVDMYLFNVHRTKRTLRPALSCTAHRTHPPRHGKRNFHSAALLFARRLSYLLWQTFSQPFRVMCF